MKIDTKKATPISPFQNFFFLDNAAIPPSAYCEHSQLGREVMYEPTVFFTPVYASKRVQEQSVRKHHHNHRLLSRDTVDELIGDLESLVFGNTTKATATDANNLNVPDEEYKSSDGSVVVKETVSSSNSAQPVVTPSWCTETTTAKKDEMGRFTVDTVDPKTGMLVTVTRSRRHM